MNFCGGSDTNIAWYRILNWCMVLYLYKMCSIFKVTFFFPRIWNSMVVVQKFPLAFSFTAVTNRQSELCKYNSVAKLWLLCPTNSVEFVGHNSKNEMLISVMKTIIYNILTIASNKKILAWVELYSRTIHDISLVIHELNCTVLLDCKFVTLVYY
jgi:hypothetical protein